ncbi:MAG: DUF3467 domain-containing protein [Chloroflexota bacterium]|nr:DUF3467 domain-containing protein [Chloroflexota bacterium]
MARKAAQQTHQVSIQLPEELEAIYSNFAVITHSPSEIVVDFARLLPRTRRTKVHARIVMTPMHAKLLHRALGENLEKFEGKYGEIKTSEEGFQGEQHIGFHR